MAVELTEQDEAASTTSTSTGKDEVDTMAGIVENGNASELALQQPASESSERPISRSQEEACIESLPDQARELSSEPEPVKPKVNLCGVCKEKPGKYKCARCYLPYCSVPCNTIHRATHPAVETITAAPKPIAIQQANGVARAGTIAAAKSKGPFAALDDSLELFQHLFKQYPRLSQQLLEIESASQRPVTEEQTIAQLDLITQYTFEKGKGAFKNRPWDQNRGNDSGVQALRNARRVYGKDGEGVRQYGELVLQILNRANAVDDAVETIAQERRDEDARVINELLQVES